MKKSKLFFIIPSAILAIVYSFTLSLLFSGCSNETEQNNTQTAQVTNSPKKANSDMSAGIITIDGKQVNLGEIPLSTKQPSQFTITPKLLYALGYEASGGNENLIFALKGTAAESILEKLNIIKTDIGQKTGIKDYKIELSNKYNSFIEGTTNSEFAIEYGAVDIFIYPKNTQDAILIGKILYRDDLIFGTSQIDMNEFRIPEDNLDFGGKNSKYYYSKYMPYNIKISVPLEELFTKEFQYKYMAKKLNDCSQIMNTFDGVLYCYSQRDIKDHAWQNATDFYSKKAEEETGYVYNIKDYYENIPAQIQVEQKKLIEEYKSKEANGAFKGKFNNFQTTYKKLFGSEYIK